MIAWWATTYFPELVCCTARKNTDFIAGLTEKERY